MSTAQAPKVNKSTAPLAVTAPLFQYVLAHSNEHPVLAKCREETLANPGLNAMMQVSPDQGRFMNLIAKLANVRKVVEVGVFTGYSSLAVALALPTDGKIYAMDISKEFTDLARNYWKEAGVESKIDLRLGPALESLDKLIAEGHAGTVDFAFIDADKANYPAYYEKLVQLVKIGGLIMVDNVLWHGKVVDETDQSVDTMAIRKLNDRIKSDDRVESAFLAMADGIFLAYRVK